MKFISIKTGAVLEPRSEMVREQMGKRPDYIPYDGRASCPDSDSQAPDGPEGRKSLEKMNKAELLEAARAAGISVPDGATKAEIIEQIEGVKASHEE